RVWARQDACYWPPAACHGGLATGGDQGTCSVSSVCASLEIKTGGCALLFKRRFSIRLPIARLNELKQTIARTDIPAIIRLNDDGRSQTTDAGIDDAEKDRCCREPAA